MPVTIYHNPKCSKSRQTLELLRERGIEPHVVEYLKTPLGEKELDALLKKLRMEPRALMRTKEDAYEEAGLANEKLTRKQLIAAMAACPPRNNPQPMPPSPLPAAGYDPGPIDAAAPDIQPGADGVSCLSAMDCRSGVCEGVGCSVDEPGTCMPEDRRCTRDLHAYCGCDGATFRASGSCPGKRVAAREACANP